MMSKRILTLLCIIAAALDVFGGHSDQTWDHLMSQLSTQDTLHASIIGFSDARSDRFELYKTIIAQGDTKRFEEMLSFDQPVVRCVGLLALAKTGGTASVPFLRKHLSDPQIVKYLAYDVEEHIAVGEFSFKLLCDANALDLDLNGHIPLPLLSESELTHLALEILAGDATTTVHESASRKLCRAMGEGILTLELASLRQAAPTLADFQIVKAIGRIKPSHFKKAYLLERRDDPNLDSTEREAIASILKVHADKAAFLIACLRRSDLDRTTRFAAASALTCSPEETGFSALRDERDRLNRLAKGLWGDHFFGLAEARRLHKERMAMIRAMSATEIEESKDEIIAALTTDRPFAFQDLLDPPLSPRGGQHSDIRQALADSLIAISRNLEGCSQPWNIYSNTAFKLDQLLQHERPRLLRVRSPAGEMEERLVRDGWVLGADDYGEIEGNVRRFTAGRPPLP